MADYRDSVTHEKVFVGKTTTKFIKGELITLDGDGNPLTNPNTGNALELTPIEGDIQAPAIMTDMKSRHQRNVKHFKDRSNKHLQSDEVQYRRKQRQDQELTNFTGIDHSEIRVNKK